VSEPKVGVVGLGNMGRGIALNLGKALRSVAVWDIAPAARAPFAGMKGASIATPGEMACACSAIFFVVPGSAEISQCLSGKQGVLANARRGLVIYDLTSSDPARTRRLAQRAAAKGVAYLDAGMSGGAAGADAGTLTLMIGGDKRAYARTRRYLSPIAANPFYLGRSGTGHALKLIHNMVCHAIFLATCEGGRMAERAGIRLADMIEVFNVSNARSYASQVRFPRHILSGTWDARSRIYNLRKDVKMAVAMGRRSGAATAIGAAALGYLERAAALGMLDRDFSLLYREFEKVATKRRDGKKQVVDKNHPASRSRGTPP
jgi:3-hydroxyisobutyrate dehydrogenase